MLIASTHGDGGTDTNHLHRLRTILRRPISELPPSVATPTENATIGKRSTRVSRTSGDASDI